jgi:hypothetical protein
MALEVLQELEIYRAAKMDAEARKESISVVADVKEDFRRAWGLENLLQSANATEPDELCKLIQHHTPPHQSSHLFRSSSLALMLRALTTIGRRLGN